MLKTVQSVRHWWSSAWWCMCHWYRGSRCLVPVHRIPPQNYFNLQTPEAQLTVLFKAWIIINKKYTPAAHNFPKSVQTFITKSVIFLLEWQ
jgi:hypothetical protein